MSQENVEIVRDAWRAFGQRGIEASIHFYADDCVCEDAAGLPDAKTYHGHEGARRRQEQLDELVDDLVLEPKEFIDAGADRVVLGVAARGRGKGSGVPIETPLFFVYELRDGKIARDRPFTERDAALQAAGLAE
jgi:ketosteroid isomerase-like protein